MTQYIPKEPLVAEIERTQKILNLDDCGGRSVMAWSVCFKKFIDTLEVKEVDLNRELDDYIEKITNRLNGKSLETLKKLYNIMTNLD